MKPKFIIVVAILTISLVSVQSAMAQLINYGRRNKTEAAAPAQKSAPAPVRSRYGQQTADEDAPEWEQKLPRVRNAKERIYDLNRDGLLQTAEVKIFLRDVIDEVEGKGGFTINSDILKPYDKNRDGVITRYELEKLRKDANR